MIVSTKRLTEEINNNGAWYINILESDQAVF